MGQNTHAPNNRSILTDNNNRTLLRGENSLERNLNAEEVKDNSNNNSLLNHYGLKSNNFQKESNVNHFIKESNLKNYPKTFYNHERSFHPSNEGQNTLSHNGEIHDTDTTNNFFNRSNNHNNDTEQLNGMNLNFEIDIGKNNRNDLQYQVKKNKQQFQDNKESIFSNINDKSDCGNSGNLRLRFKNDDSKRVNEADTGYSTHKNVTNDSCYDLDDINKIHTESNTNFLPKKHGKIPNQAINKVNSNSQNNRSRDPSPNLTTTRDVSPMSNNNWWIHSSTSSLSHVDRLTIFKKNSNKNATCVCHASAHMARKHLQLENEKKILNEEKAKFEYEQQELMLKEEKLNKLEEDITKKLEKLTEEKMQIQIMEVNSKEQEKMVSVANNKIKSRMKEVQKRLQELSELENRYNTSIREAQEQSDRYEQQQQLLHEKKNKLEERRRHLDEREILLEDAEKKLEMNEKKLKIIEKKNDEISSSLSKESETLNKLKREFDEKRTKEHEFLEEKRKEIQFLSDELNKNQELFSCKLNETESLGNALKEERIKFEKDYKKFTEEKKMFEINCVEKENELNKKMESISRKIEALREESKKLNAHHEEQRNLLEKSMNDFALSKQQEISEFNEQKLSFENFRRIMEEKYKAEDAELKQRESLISDKQANLNELKMTLDQKCIALKKTEDNIKIELSKIEDTEADLKLRMENLASKEIVLDSKEASLQAMENNLAIKQKEILAEAAEVQQKSLKLSELEKILGPKDEELKKREAYVEQIESQYEDLLFQKSLLDLEKRSFEGQRRQLQLAIEKKEHDLEKGWDKLEQIKNDLKAKEKELRGKVKDVSMTEKVIMCKLSEDLTKLKRKPFSINTIQGMLDSERSCDSLQSHDKYRNSKNEIKDVVKSKTPPFTPKTSVLRTPSEPSRYNTFIPDPKQYQTKKGDLEDDGKLQTKGNFNLSNLKINLSNPTKDSGKTIFKDQTQVNNDGDLGYCLFKGKKDEIDPRGTDAGVMENSRNTNQLQLSHSNDLLDSRRRNTVYDIDKCKYILTPNSSIDLRKKSPNDINISRSNPFYRNRIDNDGRTNYYEDDGPNSSSIRNPFSTSNDYFDEASFEKMNKINILENQNDASYASNGNPMKISPTDLHGSTDGVYGQNYYNNLAEHDRNADVKGERYHINDNGLFNSINLSEDDEGICSGSKILSNCDDHLKNKSVMFGATDKNKQYTSYDACERIMRNEDQGPLSVSSSTIKRNKNNSEISNVSAFDDGSYSSDDYEFEIENRNIQSNFKNSKDTYSNKILNDYYMQKVNWKKNPPSDKNQIRNACNYNDRMHMKGERNHTTLKSSQNSLSDSLSGIISMQLSDSVCSNKSFID